MMAAVMVMAGLARLLQRLYGGHLSGGRSSLELAGELVKLVCPSRISLALRIRRRLLKLGRNRCRHLFELIRILLLHLLKIAQKLSYRRDIRCAVLQRSCRRHAVRVSSSRVVAEGLKQGGLQTGQRIDHHASSRAIGFPWPTPWKETPGREISASNSRQCQTCDAPCFAMRRRVSMGVFQGECCS